MSEATVESVQELKEVMSFVIGLGESLDKAMSDKKFDVSELGLLIAPLMLAPQAFTGLDKLAGLKGLSESQTLELVEFVKTELDLENDKAEVMVEKGLEMAAKLYGFVLLFKKTA